MEFGNWFLSEVTLSEAMQAFLDDKIVLVKWDDTRIVKKDTWVELNINHLQRGQWYVKIGERKEEINEK